MSEENEKKESELEALTYALFRAANEFKSALDQYEENDGKLTNEHPQSQIWNGVSGTVAEVISKYNLSLDSLIETLPPEYRPIARVAKKMRVDQVIDIASDIAKEYTKDENGNYRSLEETLTRVAGKRFLRRIFKG